MKIAFTQEEVEKIVLQYVRTNFTEHMNSVRISHYSGDYCVVMFEEPKEKEDGE